jgi:hypothetical protein
MRCDLGAVHRLAKLETRHVRGCRWRAPHLGVLAPEQLHQERHIEPHGRDIEALPSRIANARSHCSERSANEPLSGCLTYWPRHFDIIVLEGSRGNTMDDRTLVRQLRYLNLTASRFKAVLRQVTLEK